MRELMRSVAKGRLKALGADRINRRMNMTGPGGPGGMKNWRRVLTGDLAKRAEGAQRMEGLKAKRKLKKVQSRA